jgi:hypothetical protein
LIWFIWFEIHTAIIINVTIFWNIALCGPYVKRRFGGQAGFLPVWFLTLRMQVIHSSETSVHIRSRRCYIPQDGKLKYIIIIIIILLLLRWERNKSLTMKNIMINLCINYKKTLVWVRERTVPTERPLLVGEFSAKFVDRRCHVVSMTDPYGRILGFIDRKFVHYQHIRYSICS